ncbi:MAG: YfhO family protein [Oscillospiraceae bacterium]|nr:YfhO family protein [Oscillospiraceae bacterium]
MTKFTLRNPLPAIRKFFRDYPQIWVSFCISFVGMLVAYLIFGIWPMPRGMSVLCLDMNAQYVYYHIYMRDALFWGGGESILYSWGRNFSGEYVGTIGYYLFSPFNLIAWLVPLRFITEGLLLMILTKIGSAAAAMAIYLSVWRKFSPSTTIMFSVMYALSAYNMIQTMNPMWLDAVIMLPLIVLGIEALLKDGKFKLLAFALTYTIITNFYIGLMVCIFAALYFVYYALTSRRLNVGGNWKVIGKRTGIFAAVAICSALMSAFILLPVYSSLSLGKFDFTVPDYSLRASFTMFDMTRKMFLNSYDTVRNDGLPALYVGTLALIMLPVYLFCTRIRRVRRFGGIALLLALIMSMMVTPIDMLWHGGQVPNWLPYRYAFMFGFLMLAFGAEAFERLKTVSRGVIGAGVVFFGTILLYWQRADTVYPDLGRDGRDVFEFFTAVLPAAIALGIFAAIVILGKRHLDISAKGKGKINVVTFALICLVSVEMGFSAGYAIFAQNTDITYSTRGSFDSMHITREVTDELNREMAANGEFMRMEKHYMRSANDAMALRMRGVTHSTSVMNNNALYVMRHFGYLARTHSARYWGATPVTDDLFAFRYILDSTTNERSHGTIINRERITVFDNHDALPIAYLVDMKTQGFTVAEWDVFGNQTRLLANMLGEDDFPLFIRQHWDDKAPDNLELQNNLSDGYMGYRRTEGSTGNAHIEYTFTSDRDGELFMYFPTIYDHSRATNLWLQRYHEDGSSNGGPVFVGQMYDSDHHHIQRIGKFSEGERFMITVSLQPGVDAMFFNDEIFVFVDTERLAREVARVHENNAGSTFTAVNDRHLRITTNHSEEQLLFTSIPVEPGWRAFIDGKEVSLEGVINWKESVPVEPKSTWDNIKEFFVQFFALYEVDEEGRRIVEPVEMHDVDAYGFLALTVPAGQHTVELKFFPNMMPVGISLSFVGLAGILLLIAATCGFGFNRKAVAASDSKPTEDGGSGKENDSEISDVSGDDVAAVLAEIGIEVDTSPESDSDDAVDTGGVEDVYDGYDSDYFS